MTDKGVNESPEENSDSPVKLQPCRRGFSVQCITTNSGPALGDDEVDEPTRIDSQTSTPQSSSFIVLSPPTPSSVAPSRSTLHHSSILLRQSPVPPYAGQQSPTPDSESSDDGNESAFSDTDAQRVSSPVMTKSISQYSLSPVAAVAVPVKIALHLLCPCPSALLISDWDLRLMLLLPLSSVLLRVQAPL